MDRDVEKGRERRRHPGLLHSTMQLDRMGEERDTKGEGMRKGRRYMMENWGKVFPSSRGKAFPFSTQCLYYLLVPHSLGKLHKMG